MDWIQIVRFEHKRLRDERKVKVSNTWNRAVIERKLSDTSGPCTWKPEYCTSSGRRQNSAVVYHELQAVVPIPKMITWLPVPRNIESEAIRSQSDVPPSRKWVINANKTIDDSDGNDFMDDETFVVELIKALIPYQRYSNATQSSADNNNDSPATLDEPEPIIFQTIVDCFPARKINAVALRERYIGLTKRTPPCTPNIDQPMKEPLKRDKALASYHKLFCRKCFIYNCPYHPHDGTNFVPKLKTGDIEWMKPFDKPCSDTCYLLQQEAPASKVKSGWSRTFIDDAKPNNVSTPENVWSGSELTMLEALVHVFPDNFCVIAETIRTKTCQEVRKQFQLSDIKVSIPRNKVQAKTRGMRTQVFETVYRPCNHESSCREDGNCLCINCDKFCNCDADCKKRTVMTCNCKAPCSTKSCLCFRYQRECDPDVCGCVACKNMNIQQSRKLAKKLKVATSDIHGWGVFIDESCQRGEFITEYRGEKITTAEANRRAIVYAKEKLTYLFSLNAEYVVDAKNYGSKIRFVNFSLMPNCDAKILMVNGDHRIGIFALRHIKAGEELTIDYLTHDPTVASSSVG